MMIYRRGWVPVLYRSGLQEKLKENGFENHEEITNFLCGDDREYWAHPDHYPYQVVDNTEWQTSKDATFLQRINRIWFVPIWFITVPFQWLIRGKVGFSTTSKIGKLCQKITGLE